MIIPPNVEELNVEVRAANVGIEDIKNEISKSIIGQTYLVDRMLIGLLTNGHILLEGVPGLAKTAVVKSLAACFEAQFQRIQFTPDLLPSDIVGTMIYNPKEGNYSIRQGPIFANFVLADEINRAPAKVQSALLEAMQERQVTIGDSTMPLPEPFVVFATENPLEQHGTYPLAEAQVDRFMLKVIVTYPNAEEEGQIMDLAAHVQTPKTRQSIMQMDRISQLRQLVERVYVDPHIKNYIIQLVRATRNPTGQLKGYVRYGASPRATINLALAAKAHAFLNKRGYVLPEDIKAVAPDVLRHRLILSYEAEAESVKVEALLDSLLIQVAVP